MRFALKMKAPAGARARIPRGLPGETPGGKPGEIVDGTSKPARKIRALPAAVR